jgi:hypothetical protein
MTDESRLNAAECFHLAPGDVTDKHVQTMIEQCLAVDGATYHERDNYAWAGGQGTMTTAEYRAKERERAEHESAEKARLAVESGIKLSAPTPKTHRHRTFEEVDF